MIELSPDEIKIWEYLKKKPSTKKALAKRFNLPESTITRKLKKLQTAGKHLQIEPIGNESTPLYSAISSIEEIVSNSTYQSPISTYLQPTEVPSKDGEDFKLGFANTIYAGGKTNKKLFRNFLRYAEADKVDGIVLTGNTIWMDITRFSKYKVDRAVTTELKTDSQTVIYPDAIKAAGRDPKTLLKEKKPIYVTFKERLEMVIQDALRPLFLNKEGKPLFNNKVYIVFGDVEEELTRQHTVEALRIEIAKEKESTRVRIAELKSELKGVNKQIKEFVKLSESEEEVSEKQIKQHRSLEITKEKIVQQLADIEEYKTRVLMSNTNDEYMRLGDEKMKGYIIDKIESAIPNSKVISTGEAHIKIGNKIIKVVASTDKLTSKIADNLMDKLVEVTRMNLSAKGEAPDIVVAGGLSATYTQDLVPYIDKKQGTITLIQLPTCLDEESLEDILKDRVRVAGNKMTKLATKYDFNSGALILEYITGIQKRKLLTSNFLTNDDAFSEKEKVTEHKMLYELNISDQHHGSKYVSVIETESDIKYAFTVAQELVLAINAPIIKINSLGDELQEKNYDTEKEEHEEYLYPAQLEKEIGRIMEMYKDNPEKKQKELTKLLKRNTIRSGIISPQKQRFDFLDSLIEELLAKTLKRARDAKLYGPVINILNGNHNVHTFEGLQNTSEELARELKIRLKAANEEIQAKILGKGGVYSGTFGVKDHYLWGEYCRHKQGSSKSSKDPTRTTRLAFDRRGQDFPEFKEKYVINRAGHTHMGGQTTSKNVLHDIGYCFMDRNEFGEMLNYGSPMRGFKINGFPIDGPAKGPIVTIEFPVEYITKWANEKPKVNTEKLFNNSII
ncbi:hypothetical protein HY643_03550 [Candidatus Woesearchaeota archaeon]|nr:hypothetical protein [Candidatus Woesearchaeota archaeon]